MRISKELAKSVAKILVSPKLNEVEKARLAYGKVVRDFYEKEIPPAIKKLEKQNREWLSRSNYISFSGYGFSWESVKVDQSVITRGGSSAQLTLDANIAKTISEYHRKYETLKKECETLFKETETALNNLKTFAQIEKHLPEATPFLPKSECVELAVNYNDLRSKLKVQTKK